MENNSNHKNNPEIETSIDELPIEPLDDRLLDIVSESFHEFHEAIGAHEYNHYLRAVEKNVSSDSNMGCVCC